MSDLLHGKEDTVWADSGYRGAQSRVKRSVQWHIAGRPSDMAKMPEGRAKAKARKQEYQKASIRAKVEHPFRVIKLQFGLAKVRFKGLAKNTAHVITLFAAVFRPRRSRIPTRLERRADDYEEDAAPARRRRGTN